jgi:exodeoxyribonuclease V alpha subunit
MLLKQLSQIQSDQPSITHDPEQLRAIELMLTAGVGVVTGGPGTGKTSTTKTALDHLDARGVKYALCAPTGKAARRMSEATGRPATTIHRLLEWQRGGFTRDRHHQLIEDAIIIDESSMLDVFLASSLLSAIDFNRTRAIFVGDANQLPPVGPGAFFRDLIASAIVPTVRLLTLHRAAQESWICRNAPKVLAGSGVELEDCKDFEWWQLPTNSAEYICKTVVDLVTKLRDEGVPLDEIQVLTPMKERAGGTKPLNKALQEVLNPRGKGVPALHAFDQDIYRGDKVIHTQNNYQLGVMNGELGYVLGDVEHQGLRVRFADDVVVKYSAKDARDLQLAYALTIHKCQGSEFKHCIVVCHSEHSHMLTRQLFYTAITRAKEKVYVVGDEHGMKKALATIHDSQRKTLLQQRLRGEL